MLGHLIALERFLKALGIGREYRHLPVYQISEWPRGDPKHDDDVKELKEEVENVKSLHMDVEFRKDFAVKGLGWQGRSARYCNLLQSGHLPPYQLPRRSLESGFLSSLTLAATLIPA
jgi:hypothetical protein